MREKSRAGACSAMACTRPARAGKPNAADGLPPSTVPSMPGQSRQVLSAENAPCRDCNKAPLCRAQPTQQAAAPRSSQRCVIIVLTRSRSAENGDCTKRARIARETRLSPFSRTHPCPKARSAGGGLWLETLRSAVWLGQETGHNKKKRPATTKAAISWEYQEYPPGWKKAQARVNPHTDHRHAIRRVRNDEGKHIATHPSTRKNVVKPPHN